MFFSKLALPVFAMLGVVSSVVATPVAQPVAGDIVARQTDVLSNVEGFQSTISPIIASLTQAAATGSDPTSSVDQLVSAFGSSTKSFGHSSASGINIDLVVGVGAGIVADVVVGLSKLPLLDVTAKAKVDGALSVWLTALDKTSPGIAAKVGKGVPAVDLNLFASLGLLLSAKVLGLVNILGIINL